MKYIDFLLKILTETGEGGGYPEPTGSITITANGTYDVKDDAEAVVNIPSDDQSGLILARTITSYTNNDITAIGIFAFDGCSLLTDITAQNVITISDSAFENCSRLVDIDFGTGVTTLGVSALKRSNIKKAIFPACTSIGGYCFQYCTSLKTADFTALSAINANSVFYGCSSLTQLILRKSDAVVVLSGSTVLNNTPIASGTGYIYVPSALMTAYAAATNWSTYAAQFRALEDYTVDGTITGDLDTSKI